MLYICSLCSDEFFNDVLTLATLARVGGDLIWAKILDDSLLYHDVKQS